MTYPLAFRKKVLFIKTKEGLTYKETASRFYIGIDTLVRWNQNLEPKLTKNRPCLKIDMDELQEKIGESPDIYQHELAEKFTVSQSAIHYALSRLKISNKKNLQSSKG